MRDLLDRRPDFVRAFDKHPEELMKVGRAPALHLMLNQHRELKAALDKKQEVRELLDSMATSCGQSDRTKERKAPSASSGANASRTQLSQLRQPSSLNQQHPSWRRRRSKRRWKGDS